ncbi:MAG: endopeptidase La [Spirochaetes bacterium]|nr:endopeptidase La [Spirochaetota bacterium]
MKKTVDETKKYPLLPLRDVIVFPHMVIPLFVGREKSINALDEAMKNDRFILLVTQKDAAVSEPEQNDIYEIGTLCEVLQMLKLPNGTIKVLVEGISRAYIENFSDTKDSFYAQIKLIDKNVDKPDNFEELKSGLLEIFEKYLTISNKIPKEALTTVKNIEEISHFTDVIASHISMRLDLKQILIETGDPYERVKLLKDFISGEIEILDIEKKIHGKVRKQMEKTQKDYYLNEQIKIIRKELGSDDGLDEIEELTKSIEDNKLSKEAKTKAVKEIKRLEKMPPMSAESSVVRNYIEWLRDIPWNFKTKDNRDIDFAESVLNKDHYGLEEAKERVLEFIAVRHLSKKVKGPIICFVGPPGVGKTSLGRSVARALGRKFVRISLGGVRDEAEIRGHRRTYVGSMPGKIIQAMKKAGTVNPVILLDEIDKMSTDFRGDPSSALLEVLDPEQNNTFVDHFIEIPYDLSEVLFITTANVQHNIPVPLQDRMEIIEITSYTEFEKLNIANQYLIPKQIKENGISNGNILFSDSILFYIIRHYTRESGVRNLERTIGKICRKTACEVVKSGENHVVELTKEKIHSFLGPIKFKYGETEKTSEIGLANGLAWTAVGGDVMQIEASLIKGKGSLMLTGKLGEVMQESAQAAFTYVKSNIDIFNIDENITKEYDVHLHVPEGAIPKDGPSAGITMAVVIASLLSKIPVKYDVAMTGEITLRGKVLPIGGLKEKILAAHRAKIKHIIIPDDNVKDLEKIPDNIKSEISVHPVTKMNEVLFLSLEKPEVLFKNSDNTDKFNDHISTGKQTVDTDKITENI